ncbi:MIF4G domain-containing protein isoform 1-T2 [Trichechus inunguis]
MVMGEPRREEYKIQSFDAETQQLLKTALKDPGAVDLDKVANVIVDHSLQDCVFSKEAGRMCYAIIQAESKQAGQSVFRRGLLNRLQQEYQAREQLRARSLQGWVCYVTFICNVFDYLRVRPQQPPWMADSLPPKAQAGLLPTATQPGALVLFLPQVNNMPMMALVNPVYDCLFRLAQPDSLSKEEEVGGLTQGCGGGQSGLAQRASPLSMEVFEGTTSWDRCLAGAFKACHSARYRIYPKHTAAKASGSETSFPEGKLTCGRHSESYGQLWMPLAWKPNQGR